MSPPPLVYNSLRSMHGAGTENEEMAEEAEGAISCTPECRNDKAYWLARHST